MIIGNFYRRNFISLLFVMLLASTFCARAEPLRVGFLCPKPPGQGFWSQVIQVMQAVAEDLDVDLQVKCGEWGGAFGTKWIGDQLLNSEPKLDYLLTGYWPSITKDHLKLAKERGIKVFIFNADIVDYEKAEMGDPRTKYDNWIGHMVPDDEGAAAELIKILVDRAGDLKKKTAPDSVHVYAFIGEGYSAVARERYAGLRKQIEIMPIAELHEIPITTLDRIKEFWEVNNAKERVVKLMSNSSGVDVIWAGNQDGMWGAVQGVEQAGKIPGKDVFIGGFDWDPDSIQAIADGRISASMFGHFIEGAWALLLVHDYHYGFDFADEVGVKISTPMGIIMAGNNERYKAILNKAHWQSVDFKMLSKKYNPELKSYNFDISQFLN
ncbi:MAG: ABC transporter substrate-binding protein [Gammaproteobacteria bacterium]|nr:ABC transporter substrate-binding protein [Gammaproteobacteria bacterium]